MVRLNVESPSDTIGDVLQAIAQLGGSIAQTQVRGTIANVEARLPADRSWDLQKQLVGLTSGRRDILKPTLTAIDRCKAAYLNAPNFQKDNAP